MTPEKMLSIAMVTCGALATGLPPMEAAFPPNATPYIKGFAAVFALLTTVFGAVTGKLLGGPAPIADKKP